jgi:hypothetical protein
MPSKVATTCEKPFRVWVGGLDWDLFDAHRTDSYLSLGASYDPIKFGNHFEAGVYFDSAGWMNRRPSYEYFGGGLEARAYLEPFGNESFNPYASVGYGAYDSEVTQQRRFSKTTLAPRFAIGLEYSRRVFLEGSYTAFGDHFQRDLGRFGIEIGVHF